MVYEGFVGIWLPITAGRNLSRPIPLWCCMYVSCCFLLMLADSLPQSQAHVECSEEHKGSDHSMFDLSNHLIVHCLLLFLMISVRGKRVWELSYTKVTEASCRNSRLTVLIMIIVKYWQLHCNVSIDRMARPTIKGFGATWIKVEHFCRHSSNNRRHFPQAVWRSQQQPVRNHF